MVEIVAVTVMDVVWSVGEQRGYGRVVQERDLGERVA